MLSLPTASTSFPGVLLFPLPVERGGKKRDPGSELATT